MVNGRIIKMETNGAGLIIQVSVVVFHCISCLLDVA